MPGAAPNFACERCNIKGLDCDRNSLRYRSIYARKMAALRTASNPSRMRRARHSHSDPHGPEPAPAPAPEPAPAPAPEPLPAPAPEPAPARATEPATAPAPVPVESVPAPAVPVPAPPAATPTPAPVLRSSRSRRAPVNGVAGPSRVKPSPPVGDASLDTHGPAGHDSAGAALFWRSELTRAEGAALGANRHLKFVRGMYADALGRCSAAPPEEGHRSKHVKVSGPSPLDTGKGKAVSRNEDTPGDKGKGRAWPMDVDEDQDASGDSE